MTRIWLPRLLIVVDTTAFRNWSTSSLRNAWFCELQLASVRYSIVVSIVDSRLIFMPHTRSLLRRLYKMWRSLGSSLGRRALLSRAAPSFEHEELLKGIGPLQTVVDVGANVGQFSLLTRMTHPAAAIHAFEPLAAAARVYERVLGAEPGVTLHRCALGSSASEARINVTARSDSSSLLAVGAQADVFPGTQAVDTETVTVRPLDAVLTAAEIRAPALLKIDVQGFEGEVLKGCAPLLNAFEWIYCEASFVELYSGQPLADEIIGWLSERGFRLVSITADPSLTLNGRAVQADFLFHRTPA